MRLLPACPILFVLILSIIALEANSQSQLKWGKLSKTEIELKECAYEPEAEAIILATVGEVEFNYGVHVFIRKHIRIKILKEAGLKHADIIISYYNKNETESINSLKAQTLNIDEKGNVVAYKVESNHIFDVQKNEFWKEKRFIFPSVKVSSIIEYSYVTVSKNVVFLKGWTFQDEIPTLYSEMKAKITEGLDYRILYQGNRLIKKYKDVNGNTWSLVNLPSIKEEPFTTNHYNYAESIRFQLAGYNTKKVYNQGYEYVSLMTTWEKLAQELLTEESYKAVLNRPGKAKEILYNCS
ncbi:hypothetical protein BH23BAC1_BH23BAC1_51770 [soil metagenome]